MLLPQDAARKKNVFTIVLEYALIGFDVNALDFFYFTNFISGPFLDDWVWCKKYLPWNSSASVSVSVAHTQAERRKSPKTITNLDGEDILKNIGVG